MKILRILLLPLYIIAVITKRLKNHSEHKQRHKKLPFEIEYVIDSKNKTLQEVQAERRLMRRIILENL